jgi:hypothetical protein
MDGFSTPCFFSVRVITKGFIIVQLNAGAYAGQRFY